MIYHAIAIQCKNCNKLYPKNLYNQHLSACNRENERISTITAQMQVNNLEISVNSVEKQKHDYIYEILITKYDQSWTIKKSLIEIKEFLEELHM